jgi:hypothetical protein
MGENPHLAQSDEYSIGPNVCALVLPPYVIVRIHTLISEFVSAKKTHTKLVMDE